MSIDIAFYPHILDNVLDALYVSQDEATLRSLSLTSSALHALVQRKLLQHTIVRRIHMGIGVDIWRGYVWDNRLTNMRVMDIDVHGTGSGYDVSEKAEPIDLPELFDASQPNAVRFFSRMHHRFVLQPANLQVVIFNVDIPDSGFATVYPEDDLVVACPLPDIPLNVLHLRYDQRGMGDFGFAFEALPPDDTAKEDQEDGVVEVKLDHRVHEVCILAKQYDFGRRPKSPWRSTLLNQLATSALAYLHAHPQATITLVGMDGWDTWCGSPFPDEEWEPTPARHFTNKAEKVRYLWDWMFEHEFGRRYADIEELKARVKFEKEADFRERVGEELFELVLQPPDRDNW